MNKTPKLRFKEFSGDWYTHLLGKSITLYDNERKPVKEQERNSGIYAYYGATGIIDYIDNYIFEGEYLLLGEDGANIVTRNAPLIYKTEGKFWVNNHAHIFKPKFQFNIDFMKQRLELINYIPYNTGTAQPKLNADSIKSIPFNAPSKEEQEKIAYFFSLIDDKISLQCEKLEILKDYKKGMMQKIFSRELRFKDDDGRDYPEWEDKKLGEIASLVKDGSHGTHVDVNDGPYLLSAKNIRDGKIIITENDRKISQDEYNKIYTNYKLEEGDILLSIVGTIGRLAIAPNVDNIAFQRSVAILRFENDNENYIIQFMNTNQFQNELITRQVVSAQPGIYLNDLKKMKIVLPCIEEQEKIAELFKNIDDKLQKEQEKLNSLNEYKKGLLQQMFV